MEKERKIKTLSLVALIIAVLGLTVAFAALNQTLTITGTATVNEASWDIHFENVGDEDTYGDATLTLPSLSGTTLSNYSISVTKPGDYASFEFDIVNDGTIDAKISNVVLGTKIEACLKDSSDESCLVFDFDGNGKIDTFDYSDYVVKFSQGLYYVDTDKKVSKKDVLEAGETKRVRLEVYYNDDATTLLKSAAELTTGTSTIEFVQVD